SPDATSSASPKSVSGAFSAASLHMGWYSAFTLRFLACRPCHGEPTLRETDLRSCRIAGGRPGRLGPGTQQQIEGGDVRDHQQGHVDDRDRVCGAQFSRQRGKAGLVAVIIVDDDVGRSQQMEGDDQGPEERAYPDGEKRQNR